MHPAAPQSLVRPRQRAFTLIELLAVVAIIGVLAGISILTVGRVRSSARSSRCGANIRQIQSLALVWAKDNRDWVPQGLWYTDGISKLRAGATNLRSVGYTDELGTCPDGDDLPAPNYGINNKLVQGSNGEGTWGKNDVQFYEHGRYKYSQIQGAKTIIFAETQKTSGGWSISGAGAYMSAYTSLGPRHDDKAWVAYADGHVELKAPSKLTDTVVWNEGITN